MICFLCGTLGILWGWKPGRDGFGPAEIIWRHPKTGIECHLCLLENYRIL